MSINFDIIGRWNSFLFRQRVVLCRIAYSLKSLIVRIRQFEIETQRIPSAYSALNHHTKCQIMVLIQMVFVYSTSGAECV